MKKIIFATQNKGKVKEVKNILADLDIEVLTLAEAGINIEIEENGETFEQNAIIKAEALKEFTDYVILADDSGLEVDYINKEPGVYSARYMGEDTSYIIKNQNIIDRLEGVPKEERTARFVCAIAAAGKNIDTVTTVGTIEGYIGYKPLGSNGFGYDPIFYIDEYNTSTASLTLDVKNKISHRGKALRLMKEKLQQIIGE